jgi:hypothetical protein
MIAVLFLLAALPLRAQDADGSHRAPASSSAEQDPVEAGRQSVLAEMWQRRVLPPDAVRWTADDAMLLKRLRAADAAGAVDFLRRRLHGLKGLAVQNRPAGGLGASWRLTKEGYDRWKFLRAQDAVAYFDDQEVGAKSTFQLADADGKRLFEKNGLLTDEGEIVWSRIEAGRETHWKTPGGETLGNKRRPPPRPKEPEETAEQPAQKPAPRKREAKEGGRSRTVIAPPEAQAKPVAPAPAPAPVPKPHLHPQGAPEAPAEAPKKEESP